VVDGQSLFDTFGYPHLVSCLAWFPYPDVSDAEGLLVRRSDGRAEHRRALYVCAACGDIGCGAVTLVVEKNEDRIIWRNFAYQRSLDVKPADVDELKDIGPFIFDSAEYFSVVEAGIQELLSYR